MKPSNQETPQYIKKHEIESADLHQRISYFKAEEDKRRNDLHELSIKYDNERERREKKRLIISTALLIIGTIGASVIGSASLFLKGTEKDKTCDAGIETILNIQDLLHKLDSIYTYERSSANHCKVAMSKINDLHREKYPEKYYSQFGYHKGKK